MKVDTGLQDGIGALRRDDELLDLTLLVDEQKFRVHKVVLASVSDYFRAMLCGSMKESKSDVVELKQFPAEQISNLLDFIYTGDNDILGTHPKEMLECGVYFQVPKVIQFCTQTLTDSVCVGNCLELLSTFLQFPVDDTAQMIRKFIKSNMKEVIDHYKADEMTLEVVQLALKNWKHSEWELFNYLISWIAIDYENRIEYMNDFMQQVRFKLMTPDEISAVKETAIYADPNSSWKGLVDKAATNHQLPIHQKVLDKSIQNRVRHCKSLFIMDTEHSSYGSSLAKSPIPKTYVSCKNDNGMDCWKQHRPAKAPQGENVCQSVIEVNNFLIICSTSRKLENQCWQIYDPRTLTWHDIDTMPRPRRLFPTVYFNKHLYVLGGSKLPPVQNHYPWEYLDTVEQYSFETDSWSTISTMPLPMVHPEACVLKGAIYVCGERASRSFNGTGTANLECLDLSTQRWESKAPLLKSNQEGHEMCVMKIKTKDSIVVIYHTNLKIDFYDPETDQWSHCNFTVSRPEHFINRKKQIEVIWDLNVRGHMVFQGNTIFMTNVCANNYWNSCCFKWTIPEGNDKSEIVEMRMGDVPCKLFMRRDGVICSMLAFPARSANQELI